jgi:hypothetical protein
VGEPSQFRVRQPCYTTPSRLIVKHRRCTMVILRPSPWIWLFVVVPASLSTSWWWPSEKSNSGRAIRLRCPYLQQRDLHWQGSTFPLTEIWYYYCQLSRFSPTDYWNATNFCIHHIFTCIRLTWSVKK